MAIQDVERVIHTVADSMAEREDIARLKEGTFTLRTSSGMREFKRPEIIRTARVNGMVLTRDEIRAFAGLKARSRRLTAQKAAG